MPMIFLGLGIVAFVLLPEVPSPDPIEHRAVTERVTELCVIVALFGAGLALDRPVGGRRWSSTWRLLGITMPLTMLAVGLLGWWAMGLGAASAVLLAAVVAPTDPVLASDVQVAEPTGAQAHEEQAQEDEPRFALTSEAGLNDGLAFPLVYAAVAMAVAGPALEGWFGHWVLVDLLWRVAAGIATGVAVGWALGRLFFGDRHVVGAVAQRLTERAEGFVALGAVAVAYGSAEAVEGYGFIAVFACACTVRAAERSHGYHGVLHGFIEQVERLLTAGILLILGGAIARGLLEPLRPVDVLVVGLVLLVVRPLAGWVGLAGSGVGPHDQWVIAFFGVRGIGSLYHLAYALGQADVAGAERLWAVTGLVVLASVVLHGASATPVMNRLDRLRHGPAAVRTRRHRTPR